MKRYQAVAFLLSTAMTVSSVAPVFGASNDVFGHWAEFTITKWQNEGRIGGYEDGTFKPDKSITRAEFVRLLNSAVPTAFTSSTSVNFSDVKESDWFFADVSKAVGSGVTSGFEDGTFRPGETVTRMQAAVFIAKAKGLTPNEAAADNFTDAASIPAWAKGAVGAAVSAGYLSGYPDGSFGGSKGMTRAEAVSTLDRVLGGTSTSNQTPSTGEVDTTDRDSQEKEETPTTANAGDMVWTSGGSGGGRRSSSSSSGGSSSSSSNTVNGAVTIRSQSDANDYKGKVLTGKATIYAKDGLELNDIKFKGDVDIIADSTATAAAYIDGDTAVAAAYLSDIKIYFEGRTNVSGTITVIRDGVPHTTQVVIITRTPRAISAALKAFRPTRIVGFEIGRVEASAPIEVAKDAKVGTVTADDGASVVAEGDVDNVNVVGKVDNIELSGTGSTDVTVDDGASVEKIDVKDDVKANVAVNGNAEVKNVAVSGNASAGVDVKDNATVGNVAVSDSAVAKVDVKDTAKVEKVDIADSATANVDVAPEAKVDTVTSTSTAAGSTVTGEGEVGKIESTNPGTIEKGEEVTTPVETPTNPDDNTGTTDPTPEVKEPSVSADKTTVELDGTTDAKVVFTAKDFAADAEITWSASGITGITDDNITTSDATDKTKATLTIPKDTDAGEITVTAKAGEVTATAKITVTVKKEGPTKEQLETEANSKLGSLSIAAAVGTTKADLTTTITTKAEDALKGTGLEGWTVAPNITAGMAGDTLAADETSLTVSYTITKDSDANSPIEVADKTVTVTVAGSEAEAAAKNELQVLTIPEFAASDTVDDAAVVNAIKEAAKAKIENNAALNGYTLADPVVTGFNAEGQFSQTVNVTYTLTKAGATPAEISVEGTVEVKKAAAEEIASVTLTGFTAPVNGEGNIGTIATSETKKYSVGTTTAWVTSGGKTTATVELTPVAGYTFKEGTTFTTFTIKGTDGKTVGTVAGDPLKTTDIVADGKATFTVTYEEETAAGTATISGMTATVGQEANSSTNKLDVSTEAKDVTITVKGSGFADTDEVTLTVSGMTDGVTGTEFKDSTATPKTTITLVGSAINATDGATATLTVATGQTGNLTVTATDKASKELGTVTVFVGTQGGGNQDKATVTAAPTEQTALSVSDTNAAAGVAKEITITGAELKDLTNIGTTITCTVAESGTGESAKVSGLEAVAEASGTEKGKFNVKVKQKGSGTLVAGTYAVNISIQATALNLTGDNANKTLTDPVTATFNVELTVNAGGGSGDTTEKVNKISITSGLQGPTEGSSTSVAVISSSGLTLENGAKYELVGEENTYEWETKENKTTATLKFRITASETTTDWDDNVTAELAKTLTDAGITVGTPTKADEQIDSKTVSVVSVPLTYTKPLTTISEITLTGLEKPTQAGTISGVTVGGDLSAVCEVNLGDGWTEVKDSSQSVTGYKATIVVSLTTEGKKTHQFGDSVNLAVINGVTTEKESGTVENGTVTFTLIVNKE